MLLWVGRVVLQTVAAALGPGLGARILAVVVAVAVVALSTPGAVTLGTAAAVVVEVVVADAVPALDDDDAAADEEEDEDGARLVDTNDIG